LTSIPPSPSIRDLSSYDASYLELAIRLGLPLAAQDGKLKTAAQATGVPLFQTP
jgi:predicted nucleic acid-binding protein